MTATVLYVDDEPANRIVFQAMFGTKFRVVAAESGMQALEIMARDHAAVVVSDQRMPGMTGHELLARVRELSPDTVRIIITAYVDVDPILRAINEGLVARYLIKPWQRAQVEETLSWAVDTYVARIDEVARQRRLKELERLAALGAAVERALAGDGRLDPATLADVLATQPGSSMTNTVGSASVSSTESVPRWTSIASRQK